jgi:hypothetical protein
MSSLTSRPKPDLLIVSVDPGDTTGIAAILVTEERIEVLKSEEVGQEYVRSEVEWLLALAPLGADRLLGVERFVPKKGVKHQPAAQQIIGVVKDIGVRFDVEVIEQGPAEVKRMATNQLLKDLGWWHVGGGGHANDAFKQCVRILAIRRATAYQRIRKPGRIDQRKN